MRSYFLIFLGCVFIILSNDFQMRQKDVVRIYPINALQYFHFGHKNAMADLFWISTIQNIDYCENEDQAPTYNPGVGVDAALSAVLKPSRCDRGWVFQMMDFVTDLAPRFEAVYEIGGVVLSVVVDDREGAKIIFDKGLVQFPNNWVLNYRAAYHYLIELQKPGRAAELLMGAYQNGGPDYLPTLASRLYSKVGRATLGYTTLKTFVESSPDSPMIERAKIRLKELEKDLNINP